MLNGKVASKSTSTINIVSCPCHVTAGDPEKVLNTLLHVNNRVGLAWHGMLWHGVGGDTMMMMMVNGE